VSDVLVGEDVIEVSAADLEKLYALLQKFSATSTVKNESTIELTFPMGTADPAEINRFCFNNGIALSHLAIKKKRLEAKFFELTNN
jgi:ABC-2 type transport system ATP-binding protein